MATRRETIAMLTGAAAALTTTRSSHASADSFYENALVIDGLCFGRDWNEAAFEGLSASGYSGIVESLAREDLQTAIDALVEWRGRAKEHADQILIALSADDFATAKSSGRTAVLMNFQDATMLQGDTDNVEA
ncbi:MAG: membrane dipeptidase, partial [Xanthomonadales bacterium]|nr:membrane dipeptidase [Xanthomonadales bacterium]